MGRGATIAAGNPWYEARIKAAKEDERLRSREGAAEMLGMSVSSVAEAEMGIQKAMPADKALLMSDAYREPNLLNYYCLHECPIGERRPISDEDVCFESVVLALTIMLREDKVESIKRGLQDVAVDGIDGDGFAVLSENVDALRGITKVVSQLEVIRDRLEMNKERGTVWVRKS